MIDFSYWPSGCLSRVIRNNECFKIIDTLVKYIKVSVSLVNSLDVSNDLAQSSFQLNVKKNFSNHSTVSLKDTENSLGESKLKVNTCSWREVENTCANDPGLVLVSFLIGGESGTKCLSQLLSVVRQNQC